MANLPPSAKTEPVPAIVREALCGLALTAGPANVIMQLSRLPIGHGVAKSTVETGRVDRHPIKRARTTFGYLLIALHGTTEERLKLRREVNRAHARVHSSPGDAVAYNAFDPDLQLWVAACIYKGIEDFLVLHLGGHDPVLDTTLYPYCSRLATTLQVPEEMWPPTRAAFQAYWEAGLERVEMDGLTRAYLRGIADQSVLWAPLGRVGKPIAALLRPVTTFINLGWLPEPFRTELGLTWSARRQARFDRILAAAIAVNRRLPRPVREFPLNLYLRDARRRLGSNRPFV